MHAILKTGLSLALRHKKALFLAYVLNLSVACLLIIPFMLTFDASLGEGLYRQSMVEKLDYDWYELFRDRSDTLAATFTPSVMGAGPFVRNLEVLLKGELSELPPLLVGVGLLYIFLSSFLSAAIFGSMAMDPAGTTFREFFRSGGLFFGRFFRLMLIALFLFFLLDRVLTGPLGNLIEHLTATASLERTVFLSGLAGSLVTFCLFLFLNMVMDYSKIVTTTENRTSIFLAFMSALTFTITYFFPAAALYVLMGLAGLALIVLYTLIEHWIPQGAWAGILLAILLQQLYVMARLGVRIVTYSVQMQFFLDREGLYREKGEVASNPSL